MTLQEVSSLFKVASADSNLLGDFGILPGLIAAIRKLKQGKAPGQDKTHPEFVIHQSATASALLCSFYTSFYGRSKFPKIWCRDSVIALLKPKKPVGDPKAYKPSHCCVSLNILERMIHSHWHCGLHLNLLKTIPDSQIVNFITEKLSNGSFTLQIIDGL